MSTTKLTAQFAGPSPRTKDQGSKNSIGPRSQSQQRTDNLAQYLADKFKAPKHLPAFLKIAWRLDEAFIHSTAEVALSGRASNPRAYFIVACRNEMAKRGRA